jgi:hypothetical protein
MLARCCYQEGIMAGGPPKKGEPKSFQITVPLPLWEYLTYLATHSILGTAEQDVAVHILTRELNAMLASGYHDKRIPKD